jgi:O-antigen biosynthesis protein
MKISLILRTYNDEEVIRRALTSALQQTYENFEIIIVNDGSTDTTGEILATYTNPRIRVITQQNQGPYKAAHTGLAACSGEIIMLLDADDELVPDAMEMIAATFSTSNDSNNLIGFAYCDYYELEENGKSKVVSTQNIFNTVACTTFFRKSVLDNVGFWDTAFLLPEYDLLMRVKQKYAGKHIPVPLYIYHRHSGSLTAGDDFIEKAKKQLFAKYGVLEGFKEY